MRTATEINKDIEAVSIQLKNWQNINNEGAGGYNPHEIKLEELVDELRVAKKAEKKAEWTKEVTEERREWFNAQGFTSPLQALKACRAKGFEWDAMKEAVKSFR